MRRGSSGERYDTKTPFATVGEYWRENADHRASTALIVKIRLQKHVYPRIGDTPIGNIERSDIERLVEAMTADGLAPSTIDVCLRHVRTVFNSAVERQLIAKSPAKGVKVALPEVKVKPLELRHVAKLAEHVPDRLRCLVLTMAQTGLRPAEAFALTSENVTGGSVRVERQLSTTAEGVSFAPLKTESSARWVPIPDELEQTIAKHVERFGLGEHDLIFSDAKGRGLQRNRAGDCWRRTVSAIEADPDNQGYRWPESARGWHSQRHYYASFLIEGGHSIPAVCARMGHKTPPETLQTYAHLFEASDKLLSLIHI